MQAYTHPFRAKINPRIANLQRDLMSEERNIASIVQASTQQNNGEKKVDNQRCSAALKTKCLILFIVIVIIKSADGNTFVNLFKRARLPQG